MLLTASGKSPWVAVSRQRLLNAAIAEHDQDQDHKTYEQASSQTAYQRWLSEAPVRKQQQEETLAPIAAVDKAQAAKMKEMLDGELGQES